MTNNHDENLPLLDINKKINTNNDENPVVVALANSEILKKITPYLNLADAKNFAAVNKQLYAHHINPESTHYYYQLESNDKKENVPLQLQASFIELKGYVKKETSLKKQEENVNKAVSYICFDDDIRGPGSESCASAGAGCLGITSWISGMVTSLKLGLGCLGATGVGAGVGVAAGCATFGLFRHLNQKYGKKFVEDVKEIEGIRGEVSELQTQLMKKT